MAANDCSHTNHESTTTNLNDGSTYLVESIEGLLDAPVKVASAELAATPPAEVATGALWRARILRIKVRVNLQGKTYAQMWANASALIAAFAVDTRDTELGIFKYTSPASTELWIDGYYDGNEIESLSGIPRAVTIIFRCPDPTFYAPTATEYTGNTFSGTTAVAVAVTNAGDMPAYPTITYGATVTNPKVTDSRSHWFQVNETVGPTELLSDTGFETAGAGGADIFESWDETAGDGAIADETTIVNAGSHAAQLTAGASANTKVAQTITVIAGVTYDLSFYARGDGTYSGRYGVYDVSNSADITAITSASVTGTSYTQVTTTFTAPTGCTSVRLDLWCPDTDTGIAYFDDVSIQSQDAPTLTMVFDPLNKSFTHNLAGDWKDERATASRLIECPPGAADLTFVGEDASDDGAITVSINARYSRHA